MKEPLNKHGISFLQAVDKTNEEGLPMIDTILLHESGQYLSTRTPVFCAKPNDPQAFGSGITYSKRYALQALLGLPTEDDDGNAATNHNGGNGKKPEPRPQPKPEDDMTKLFEQAFFNFSTEHGDEIAEGFACDAGKFKEALSKQFKALPAAKKKDYKWTAESIKELAAKIKSADVLIEVK